MCICVCTRVYVCIIYSPYIHPIVSLLTGAVAMGKDIKAMAPMFMVKDIKATKETKETNTAPSATSALLGLVGSLTYSPHPTNLTARSCLLPNNPNKPNNPPFSAGGGWVTCNQNQPCPNGMQCDFNLQTCMGNCTSTYILLSGVFFNLLFILPFPVVCTFCDSKFVVHLHHFPPPTGNGGNTNAQYCGNGLSCPVGQTCNFNTGYCSK